ncbi:MAG: tetratricopeptide repeat protein [Fimbriimonadaceae bacterium]|nr:tetratricopeptide repeat protein [Fimbriimonadaceae bacterium]QYK58755.1 MAG: tetratricopeptide repeat protein [Fimbriimonadaceae bacterium]
MSPGAPVGTVTFLFTDIEGSTRLWEEHPEVMSRALARHDEILRTTIEKAGGTVFKTVGDAFCAAFSDPSDGMRAVVEFQSLFADEPWPEPVQIRVRAALHTGVAESRDGDYYGPPLNRVARILAVVHGGQSVVSTSTAELVRDSLPDLVELRPLGEHRLKDLGRPEALFQICLPQWTTEFPPLRSLAGTPNNLPEQITSFIGRERELAGVRTALGQSRLVTLTGSGGTGKTRLALQVAADLSHTYPDGVWLVELAPLIDGALVETAVCEAVGVKESASMSRFESLAGFLRERKVLIVLDNCEHLIESAAKLADSLTRRCPALALLATSRQPLGVSGERTYRVASLGLPPETVSPSPDSLEQVESVRLFIDRAALARPGFDVTDKNAVALASVCQRLDGIPLAIELAAARMRAMSLDELDARLDQRFKLLTGGSRTALPRQQTLRALIDWSYGLLDESERRLLARLSVFAGGWDLAGAENVCAGDPIEDWQVLDVLTSLCDKSLVMAEPSGGEVRYRLLETVRAYGRERLADSGEEDSWRDRHADHYLGLAKEAGAHLLGRNQTAWVARLNSQRDNLRAAFERLASLPGRQSDYVEAVTSMGRYWQLSAQFREGRAWLEPALQMAESGSEPLAKALNMIGVLCIWQGEALEARALFAEALEIRRGLNDLRGVANGLSNLSIFEGMLGDHAKCREMLDESLEIAEQIGDDYQVGLTLMNMAYTGVEEGDYERASEFAQRALAALTESSGPFAISSCHMNWARALHGLGHFDEAERKFLESRAMRESLGDRSGVAGNDCYRGYVAIDQGDLDRAEALFMASIKEHTETGEPTHAANAWAGLGKVLNLRQDWSGASKVLANALEFQKTGFDRRLPSFVLTEAAVVLSALGQADRAAWALAAAEKMRRESRLRLSVPDQGRFDWAVAEVRRQLSVERCEQQSEAALLASDRDAVATVQAWLSEHSNAAG